MKNPISLSAVLPAYNEEGNIGKTVSDAVAYLNKTVVEYEVIIVNDGSVDSTAEIVEELSSSNPRIYLVNHQINQGYGAALRSGFEKASLDYVFLMDSDGQFDISELDRFLPYIDDSNVVIGYRENRADSFMRTLNAWLYHVYIRAIFGLSVRDIDCAFKVFPRIAYQKVKPIKSGGALFSAELLIKLKKRGYKIIELPVSHFQRLFGKQTGANLRVILRMFKECWKLRNELRGY